VRPGSVRTQTVATVAAFGTYFAMYAFRKPFTAATYADDPLFGIDRKTLLVTAQVLGYTLSKFIGIAVVAAMPPRRRAACLLAFILSAELALLGFGLVPAPWQPVMLFCNGIPLGMVFGLVLGFLEGRRQTEAMVAGLCASFIVADGAVKSVGRWLLEMGVTERWMPFVAGLLFLAPLGACLALLARTPAPDASDIAARGERAPMTRADRRSFLRRYGPGLLPLVGAYLLVTILRSLRADFAPELWARLGAPPAPWIYTWSELLVAIGVLAAIAFMVRVRDNRRAFTMSIAVAVAGLLLCVVALLGLPLGVSGFTFMVAIGLGLYLPYVAVHAVVFERLVAMTRDRGNLAYLMYLADAFGYLGYVAVMLGGSVLRAAGDHFDAFVLIGWVVAIAGTACFAGSWWWFTSGRRRTELARTALGEQP